MLHPWRYNLYGANLALVKWIGFSTGNNIHVIGTMYLDPLLLHGLDSSFHWLKFRFHHLYFCLALPIIVDAYQAVLLTNDVHCCGCL